MPSTAATEPDFANSRLNLLACLALYQHRQDQAVGIGWTSGRVRGLLWYYSLLQQGKVFRYLTAEYLNETIQQKRVAAKTLIAAAKEAKDKQSILKQVMELEKEIEAAKAILDQTITAQESPE